MAVWEWMGLASNPLHLLSYCNHLCRADFEGHLPQTDLGTNTAPLSILNIAIGIDGLPVPGGPAHVRNVELGLPSEKALGFLYRR